MEQAAKSATWNSDFAHEAAARRSDQHRTPNTEPTVSAEPKLTKGMSVFGINA
jgi:hypothetical protein